MVGLCYGLDMQATIADIDPALILVTDSQDVEAVREYLPCGKTDDHDSYFVRVGDGEYTEIWGFYGIVPILTKIAYRLL